MPFNVDKCRNMHLGMNNKKFENKLFEIKIPMTKEQKRLTKMINGCRSLSYEKRLDTLGLTTLEDRHCRADMILVHKILNDKNNTYPLNLLQLSDRTGRVYC